MTNTEGIRRWFFDTVLDGLERRDAQLLVRLGERLPERLRWTLEERSPGRIAQPSDSISCDDGEEVLLAADQIAGERTGRGRNSGESGHAADGHGTLRLLEQVGEELTVRALLENGSAVIRDDLAATLARLRNTWERPFAGFDVTSEISRTERGLILELQATGRPRSARVLRAMAPGTIRAALRFCREAPESELRITGKTLGDRIRVEVLLRGPRTSSRKSDPPAPTEKRAPRRSTLPPKPQQPLTDEVERIMGRSVSRPPAGPAAGSRVSRLGSPPAVKDESGENAAENGQVHETLLHEPAPLFLPPERSPAKRRSSGKATSDRAARRPRS